MKKKFTEAEGIEMGKFYDRESKQYFIILKFSKEEYEKYRKLEKQAK